jgi:predicted RND superfamily exporter protein
MKQITHTPSHSGGVQVAGFFAGRPRLVLAGLLAATFALGWPMLRWTSERTASQSPDTEITRTQDIVAERFADDVFRYLLLVEAKTGNILDKRPLLALFDSVTAMRTDDRIAPYLVELHDPRLGIDVKGAWTIADSVDRLLRQAGVATGISGASEQQIDETVAVLLQQSGPAEWGLADQAAADADGVWRSPAVFIEVATDNEKLGGGGFLVTIGTDDLEKEEFSRTLRKTVEGSGSELSVWAPGADVNLTSNEQGELAGPFIGLTIAAVLLIVGFSFRSYWAVAISGAALAMLMVWLRGGANLIGLKSDQLLSVILPISMISFGIDSAFHAIGRVREESRLGRGSRTAFALGLGSVLGALALAATSDAAAFLANTAAGIESIVQFGFAAAVATVAAFLLLGIGTPLALMLVEESIGSRRLARLGVKGELVLGLVAATLATATVMVLVYVSPAIGLVLLAGYIVATIAAPLWLLRHRSDGKTVEPAPQGARWLGRTVRVVAARPWPAIAVAAVITAAASWSAVQLDASFDVKDFFSPQSDFVVALDKTTTYLGDRGGEPALVYVETDLTDPANLAAIRTFIDDVASAEDNPLARDGSGSVQVDPGVLRLLADIGGPPSTASDLAAAYEEALSAGVVDDDGNPLWTPNQVGTVLWSDGASYATVLAYAIPDTRDQTNVVRARGVLEPRAADLEAALREHDPKSHVVVTGSAVYRDDQLDAIRRALLLALPIAIAACLVAAALFMRSVRYALVTVVPILLVVIWLYGVMHQAGYSINVVTAIIGAVSIGVGIDYSTHYTMRFLDEIRGRSSKLEAVEAAGAGTGAALLGSALTSVAGFGILAFAPMPMFATYGLLTALMIVLALMASLFVLPSLLMVTTRRDHVRSAPAGRVVDLRRSGNSSVRIGLARDLSDGIVDQVLAVCEAKLRGGEVELRTVAAAAVRGLVAEGTMDLGIATRWPGQVSEANDDVEALTLAHEELVAIGAAGRISGESAAVEALAHGLLVAGPSPENEEAVTRLMADTARSPVLARTVADVVVGFRLAATTGGAMILPRSMAAAGALPVRSLDPPAWAETLLLATRERAGDREVLELIRALVDAISSDPVFGTEGTAGSHR